MCSQAVFTAFCEDYGISRETGLKLTKFLEAGYLYRADMCGAISRAMMIYGLKYHPGKKNTDAADDLSYKLSMEHMDRFKKIHGSCICKELLGADLSTPEGLKALRENGSFETKCPQFVQDSASILNQAIMETDKKI